MATHKFDEKFSREEQIAREEYLFELYNKLEQLKTEIRESCEEIAGTFRGPGLMMESITMVNGMAEYLGHSRF